MKTPTIDVAKCAICREGISRLSVDDKWRHNLGGFRASEKHDAAPVPESVRILGAYSLLDAEDGE